MRARSLLLPTSLLPLLMACGGGGAVAATDLTGPWILYTTDGGIDGDPMHMTFVQAGTSVRAEFTCNADLPWGTGAHVGNVLSLTFDLGGGDTLTLDGTGDATSFTGTYSSPEDSGTWRMETTGITLDCAHKCDAVTPVEFVTHDFTDLSKVQEISRFRSGEGHDYSDGCESCRSMKHYYDPQDMYRDNGLMPVLSPVDGTVVYVEDDGHGAAPGLTNKQVRIRSSLHPEYTFILFHVDLDSAAIVAGAAVLAGDTIGTAHLYYPDLSEYAHDFDIGVQLSTLYGPRYVSFFELMTDTLFASYMARGVPSRSTMVITQAARDADPLTCADGAFTSTGSLPGWQVLTP